MDDKPLWEEWELEITHLKGSGPGGQNRNKRLTAVRVVHLPTGISVTASERRSQYQNLEAALERLREKLLKLREKPVPRVATRKTRSSDKRRLKSKDRRSRIKSMRGRVRGDD